ncbi:PorT family protein [bacterium]|nr:PorT family protein [bacterium]MBU1635624.1 PorT family protein [bacterium]MBU1874553.1 PorT family protein [bacterium]
MKATPRAKYLHTNLNASKFYGDGFLGDDHLPAETAIQAGRPVDEIIASDLRRLFWKILVLLMIFGMLAQTPAGISEKRECGLMGGMTAARLWGDHVTKESWNPGGWLGAYLLTPVANNLYFRPEISFNMRGYRYLYANENDLQGDKSEAILRLNYLDFPLLFQFAISINESLVPDVVFGPYAAWNISATARNKIGNSEFIAELESVRKYDLGFIVGSRLHYSGHFYINLRGGAGLLPIVDKSNPPRKYNLWILAGLQYRF